MFNNFLELGSSVNNLLTNPLAIDALFCMLEIEDTVTFHELLLAIGEYSTF